MPDEYIIGPFRQNNMAFPTRYAALPYHFHLGEHGVRAGLVEDLNTVCEGKKRGRESVWVQKNIQGRGKEMQRKGMDVSVSA